MMAQTVAGLAALGFAPNELAAIERGNALRPGITSREGKRYDGTS
jgi:hypothetical protein